jgi:hypothetical protein
MSGMADMAKMAASMGLGGKNAKFNMGAMQSHLNQNIKTAKMKERMQQKLEQRKADAQAAAAKPLVFSTGEKVERTPRFPAPTADVASSDPSPVVGSAEPTAAKKKKNKNKK